MTAAVHPASNPGDCYANFTETPLVVTGDFHSNVHTYVVGGVFKIKCSNIFFSKRLIFVVFVIAAARCLHSMMSEDFFVISFYYWSLFLWCYLQNCLENLSFILRFCRLFCFCRFFSDSYLLVSLLRRHLLFSEIILSESVLSLVISLI